MTQLGATAEYRHRLRQFNRLATHPRQPLAREKLMLLARGRDHDVFDRAIDVQISRLRKLIEPDPSTPRYIQTVWGFGYVFVPDEPATPSEGA